MKYFFLFLFFPLCISLVSGIELGISPSSINLTGDIGDNICQYLTIHTNYKGVLIGDMIWSKDIGNYKKIEYYKTSSESMGLKVDLPMKINISKEYSNITFCINSTKIGNYNGAIIYKTANGYAGVGTWIDLEITGNNMGTNSPLPVTGYFSKISDNIEIKKSISLVSIVVFIMLVIMLTVLFILNKRINLKNQLNE